jgi:hypothetical protein
MAQTDAATQVAAHGHVWLGTVGTATKPTTTQLATFSSAGTVPSGWTTMGHTDAEDVLAFGQDGGDTTTLKSWQSDALRTTTESVTDYFVVKSLQVLDKTVLSLYYGGGDATTTNEFSLPTAPVATEKAVTVVILDTVPVAFYCPKVSIIRDDAFEFATDSLTTVPLKFTMLTVGSTKGIWISTQLG